MPGRPGGGWSAPPPGAPQGDGIRRPPGQAQGAEHGSAGPAQWGARYGCAAGDYTGWHTYGAEWAPGSVTYYYDGKKVGQITTGITSSPQYLILNNGVDQNNTLTADTDMQVDYVKVWQH